MTPAEIRKQLIDLSKAWARIESQIQDLRKESDADRVRFAEIESRLTRVETDIEDRIKLASEQTKVSNQRKDRQTTLNAAAVSAVEGAGVSFLGARFQR